VEKRARIFPGASWLHSRPRYCRLEMRGLMSEMLECRQKRNESSNEPNYQQQRLIAASKARLPLHIQPLLSTNAANYLAALVSRV
jgi:hypothetical protein